MSAITARLVNDEHDDAVGSGRGATTFSIRVMFSITAPIVSGELGQTPSP
jgi:hypothetical protein